MKVSIVTVAYNSERFIINAVKSVLSQTYQDIEYLIIDGASTDDTLAKINSLEPEFNGRLRVVSEPDLGIYDAMNKGLQLATGDIIGFLNSDDELSSAEIIAAIVEQFQRGGKDIVFGDIVYIDQNNPTDTLRYWATGPTPKCGMRYGWHPPHPGFYVKKTLLMNTGGFDLRYRISADYDQMVRLLELRKVPADYLPRVFVAMRTGGISNRSIKNIILANIECWLSWKRNGSQPSPFLIPLKITSKLRQKKHAGQYTR